MPQLTLTIYFLTLTRLNENWSMSMGEGKNTLVFSGLVRGGSRGSADPPKILEPVEKKLEIDILR